MPATRKYDLVLFGATGYTGTLTARHITQYLPNNLKWALAGRSIKKVEALSTILAELNSNRLVPATEIVDLGGKTLDALIKNTRIVITLASPYPKLGEPIVEACARNGTHYIDACGESYWTRRLIDKYHDTAKANSTILWASNGIGSSPPDLMTWSAVSEIKTKYSAKTGEVLLSVLEMPMDISGGTLISMFEQYESISKNELRESSLPWALSPVQGCDTSTFVNALGLRRDSKLGLMARSPTAKQHRSIVHRSWGLMGGTEGYGPNFQFNEYSSIPNYLVGLIRNTVFSLLPIALSLSPIRTLLARLTPPPGEGPEISEAKAARIEFYAVGVADQDRKDPSRVLVKLNFAGGGYAITAALLAQGAALILSDEERLVKEVGGGVLTAAMFGQPFIDRLSNVGVMITTETI